MPLTLATVPGATPPAVLPILLFGATFDVGYWIVFAWLLPLLPLVSCVPGVTAYGPARRATVTAVGTEHQWGRRRRRT